MLTQSKENKSSQEHKVDYCYCCHSHRVMASSISSSMDQLRVGQRVDVVLLDTAGPMDMRVRIHNLDKAFSDFSIGMSEHYDSAFSTGAVYMCVLGILYAFLCRVQPCWPSGLGIRLESGRS